MFFYRRLFSTTYLLACFFLSHAQTNLSGIINDYAAVTAIDKCANTISVSDVQNFFMGEQVMIIQMKGAAISTSNNATYGDVTDYQSCGNYEINTIKTINGNTIEFQFAILRSYDVAGLVQLVSLNNYGTAAVNGPVRAQPWNGQTGGIVLLKADTLILNDSISVSGLGFRGGILENDNAGQACVNSGNGGSTDYFCTTINCGARKGEGIGGAHEYGRGKNGCGGGGGDDHNTGGGGGGNFGKGGIGGIRSNTSNFNCPGPAAGVGGLALTYSNLTQKIFLGGGGGAGDSNNNRGTGGENGGGIVILMVDVLQANGKSIKANGKNVLPIAGSDGAGAGGAGGTVLLAVNSIVGNLRVELKGGNGGFLDNDGVISPQAHCMGPGGGGGGGLLWLSGSAVPAQITVIDTGGVNGHNVFVPVSPVPGCPTGTTNGASRGDAGGTLTNLIIPVATTPFVLLTANACCDDTVCPGQNVFFQSTASGTPPINFQWSSGSTSQNFTEAVQQTATYLVSVNDASGCELVRSVTITVSNNPPDVQICCDTVVCAGQAASFSVTNNSGNSFTYNWSSGQTASSIQQNIDFSQTFVVSVTNTEGCEIVKQVNVVVPVVQTSISAVPDTAVLPGQTVQLNALGDTTYQFSWSPANSVNNAAIYNPIATPLAATTYCVTVAALANCSASACIQIDLVLPDVKVPDAFSPNADGQNDVFEIFPIRYAQVYAIKIFNRWGELVFEQYNNIAWDGMYKGKPQPAGAYTCVVEFGSPYNSEKRKQLVKDIVLIR
ncbi:MAG: gliding motility-associated C-terminal domain-containing protein [Bacteroidetes bacterium]|nr:gliding motility-associated C-terminal domain-containing protein [Bacteroidota bacterium]